MGRAWKLLAMADMPSAALRPLKMCRDWKGAGKGPVCQGASCEESGFSFIIALINSWFCLP